VSIPFSQRVFDGKARVGSNESNENNSPSFAWLKGAVGAVLLAEAEPEIAASGGRVEQSGARGWPNGWPVSVRGTYKPIPEAAQGYSRRYANEFFVSERLWRVNY
jgi:hypothetical protein